MEVRNLQAYFEVNQLAVVLRWDNPEMFVPSGSTLEGFNIYRAIGDITAEFVKLNTSIIPNLYYVDKKELVEVTETLTVDSLTRVEQDLHRYILKLSSEGYSPTSGKESYSKQDVKVTYQGKTLKVDKFIGSRGQVILEANAQYQLITASIETLDLNDGDTIEVTYYQLQNALPLRESIYYKVSMIVDGEEIGFSEPKTPGMYDSRSYIWREALRRNLWMLQQEGVRVLLLKRKWFGSKCKCLKRLNYEHPDYSCEVCYGTGIEGGYRATREILISPPQAEKDKALRGVGYSDRMRFDTWTVSPIPLDEHDMIIFPDNKRFMVGTTKVVYSRTYLDQYFFDLEYIRSRSDIRYKVIVGNETTPDFYDKIRVRPEDITSKPSLEKPEIPKDELIKGKTITFENIHY